ncbi:hypothetical protein [Gryllotalpicola ginsengisoli]|uniref:hypothetical protein n=1 Tax=Gryllotalpicola ginsengisoli TaxID=444608 RepID=UPI0003B5767D|nr:hypothetical protein [Gryllotalpicola ginsengisoli]
MPTRDTTPEYLPRLAAGRHRSPRRGACFMEFASYLAGERWSDHPGCTDPALAGLARAVNDLVSDRRRQELLGDVPRVIGLRGARGGGLQVAASAAISALPVSAMERQLALAIGLRAMLQGLDELGVEAPELRRRAEAARTAAPAAARWADEHPGLTEGLPQRRYESAVSGLIGLAAVGIAEACVYDTDTRLIGMLRDAISTYEQTRVEAREVAPVPAPEAAPAPRETVGA